MVNIASFCNSYFYILAGTTSTIIKVVSINESISSGIIGTTKAIYLIINFNFNEIF